MNRMTLLAFGGCLAAAVVTPCTAPASPMASAGFNDASGLHSNPIANSPYGLGALINGSGNGEPGWAAAWTSDGLAVVQSATTFEGDGALQMSPTSGAARVIAQVPSDTIGIVQHVRFDANARLVVYFEEDTPLNNSLQGPIWQALTDGQFYVIDGTGDGCFVCHAEDTGFTWSPGQWYEIAIEVDLLNSTWHFFVDGQHNTTRRIHLVFAGHRLT